MVHFDSHATRCDLGVVENLIDVVDRATGDFNFLQCFQPISRWFLPHHIVEDLGECFTVLHTRFIGDKTFIIDQFGYASKLAIAFKLVVIANSYYDVAVGGRENLIRHNIRVCVAQ